MRVAYADPSNDDFAAALTDVAERFGLVHYVYVYRPPYRFVVLRVKKRGWRGDDHVVALTDYTGNRRVWYLEDTARERDVRMILHTVEDVLGVEMTLVLPYRRDRGRNK